MKHNKVFGAITSDAIRSWRERASALCARHNDGWTLETLRKQVHHHKVRGLEAPREMWRHNMGEYTIDGQWYSPRRICEKRLS